MKDHGEIFHVTRSGKPVPRRERASAQIGARESALDLAQQWADDGWDVVVSRTTRASSSRPAEPVASFPARRG